MKKAGEIGVPAITFGEKPEVLKYFKGQQHESDRIDIQMRMQTLLNKSELKRGEGKDKPIDMAQMRKREVKLNVKLQAKIEQEKQMSVNDFLGDRELKLSNRNSTL